MEANLALTEVAFQSDDKLAAKNLSKHAYLAADGRLIPIGMRLRED